MRAAAAREIQSPMFEFFALAIAVVAFIFARKALNQIDALGARLHALEAVPPVVISTFEPPRSAAAEIEIPIAPVAADEIGDGTTGDAAIADQPAPPSLEPDAGEPASQA